MSTRGQIRCGRTDTEAKPSKSAKGLSDNRQDSRVFAFDRVLETASMQAFYLF